MNTFLQEYGESARSVKTPISANPRPTIIFKMNDGAEIHVTIERDGEGLEVRSSGPHTGSLVIHPRVSNDVLVTVDRHF